MCGLAGCVWFSPAAGIDESTLRSMTETLRHRGPDGDGFSWSSEADDDSRRLNRAGGVALGFRRLAIVDPVGGSQPFASDDAQVRLVCNGEIYNAPELRRRLEGGGRRLRTRSDVEPLLHLYEEEGEDFLQHVWGMFSLALWDGRKRKLILARDRLGKKPLYFRHEPGRICFASELKALRKIPGASWQVDPTAVDHFLALQYIPSPLSIWQGVEKLRPAEMAVFDDRGLRRRIYWKLDPARIEPTTLPEAAERLRSLLGDAVERRLQADCEVGVLLSGGLDSTAVAALARQAGAAPPSFSAGFAEAPYDERAAAAATAKHLGLAHADVVVTPDDWDLVPRIASHFDEPFGDGSALPTWIVSRLAAGRVKAVLTGDGGDELLLGYPRYHAADLAARVATAARFLPLPPLAWLAKLLPAGGPQGSRLRQARRFLEAAGMPPAERYFRWIAIFDEVRRAELYSDDFASKLTEDPLDALRAWMQPGRSRGAATQAASADVASYLPEDLLVKIDRAGMAHGLECRCPFLDHRVVEFSLALPSVLKLSWGRGKRVLREMLRPLVPPETLKRRKQGFGAPLADWFRGPWKARLQETLLDGAAADWLRRPAVEALVSEHLSGRFDHGARLWSLVVLELWRKANGV